MIGMAMKKLNSAAARRSTPSSIEPTMVEPERDTPGTSDKHWNRPIDQHLFSGSAMPSMIAAGGAFLSMTSRITPPTSSDHADHGAAGFEGSA
jgi:hypothetical protein